MYGRAEPKPDAILNTVLSCWTLAASALRASSIKCRCRSRVQIFGRWKWQVFVGDVGSYAGVLGAMLGRLYCSEALVLSRRSGGDAVEMMTVVQALPDLGCTRHRNDLIGLLQEERVEVL